MTESVEVRVTGRVQGVWFRGWTKAEAEARGLSGWVRNDPDGSVRALLSGAPDDVREMVALLHDGPPLARVAQVVVTRADSDARTGFRILK